MSKLEIFQWSGEKREVQFVGFNRDQTACFIRDEQSARRALMLHLPKIFDIRFYKNPIGNGGSPPVEINRAILHLPACFSSQDEKEAFGDRDSMEWQTAKIFGDGLWKGVTRHKCWLEPKDDEKLSAMLREELDRLRHRRAIREKETADQIAALPTGETKRAEELRNMLRGEFTTFAKGENGRLNTISIFDVPLDMVRHGWGELREKLIEREWTKHFGIDLKMIPVEAASFRAWLQKHAYNARQRTTDLQTKTVELGHCLNLYPSQWEVLEAAVLYEVRFADGTRCWLDDIEERAVTSPEEVEDFEKLESAQKPAESQKPTPGTWHSEDFREIYLHDRNGNRKDVATLNNSLRALCLLLDPHIGKPMAYTEIEPKIGALAGKLDRGDNIDPPSPDGPRRIYDLLRTVAGVKLKRWRVLVVSGAREKFVELSPPKAK